MKNDEETAAAIVALLLVKKNKEKGKRPLTREENESRQELRFEDESK